jgi:hypothetical protein
MTILVIDSRDAISGDLSSFTVQLTSPLNDVSRISLIGADVHVPAASAEAYFYVTLDIAGVNCRSSSSNNDSGSFVLPITSPADARMQYSEGTSFTQGVYLNPRRSASSLRVSYFGADHTSAGLTAYSVLYLRIE